MISILELTGIVMNPAVRAIYDSDLVAVRAQLSESEFDAAFAFGQDMTVDEAVRFALDGSG